jgi:hypothetical protein
MSYLAPAQTDEALLTAELIRSWRRSELSSRILLPDPVKDGEGADIDELCPIFFYGQRFDPANAKAVAPFSPQQIAGGPTLGVGYLIANVGPESAEELPSSSPGNPGREDRTVPLEVRIVVPSIGGRSTAKTYGSALSLIFSGFGVAPPNDPYEYCITNVTRPPGAPTLVSDDTFLAEWRWAARFVRTALSTIAGPAPAPVQAPSGRVVVDPSGSPVYA